LHWPHRRHAGSTVPGLDRRKARIEVVTCGPLLPGPVEHEVYFVNRGKSRVSFRIFPKPLKVSRWLLEYNTVITEADKLFEWLRLTEERWGCLSRLAREREPFMLRQPVTRS